MSLKAELNVWENLANTFTASPGTTDTATTISNVGLAGELDWMIIGFEISRAAGTISKVTFKTHDAAPITMMIFPLPTASAEFSQFDIPRGIRGQYARDPFNLDAIIDHSAIASGGLTLVINYWVKRA